MRLSEIPQVRDLNQAGVLPAQRAQTIMKNLYNIETAITEAMLRYHEDRLPADPCFVAENDGRVDFRSKLEIGDNVFLQDFDPAGFGDIPSVEAIEDGVIAEMVESGDFFDSWQDAFDTAVGSAPVVVKIMQVMGHDDEEMLDVYFEHGVDVADLLISVDADIQEAIEYTIGRPLTAEEVEALNE